VLSHRQNSHSPSGKRLTGRHEAQGRELVKLLKIFPVFFKLSRTSSSNVKLQNMITEIQSTAILSVVSTSKAIDTKEQVPEAFVDLS
jgi:hypothetical protein